MAKEIDMWTTEYVQQLPAPAPTQTEPVADKADNAESGDNLGNGNSDSSARASANSLQDAILATATARHPVLEYTKGTGLLPIIEALGGEDSANCQTYLGEFDRLLYEAYPIEKISNKYTTGGKYVTLFPFKRLFMVCKM
jgi:trans-aconitate methyltransferase